MSKATEAYAAKVRAHLDESFPDAPPPVINLVTADWIAAVKAKCEPPKSMNVEDVDTTIIDTLYGWLADLHYEGVGSSMVNAERHEAQKAAEAQQAAAKREQEIAPMLAVMKRAVTEVMVESGLLQMKPTAVVKPHPTKRGPGRSRH